MKAYCYEKEWEEVLPYGKAFCSWGGPDFSRKLIQLMSIKSTDRVLDMCCGYGGTLSLIKIGELHGVDVDINAVDGNISRAKVICADATRTNYEKDAFDVIFAQDPDVMLYGLEEGFFREIRRVGKSGARVFIQTYASSGNVDKFKKILGQLGYSNSSPVSVEKLKRLSNKYLANVKFVSLHEVYSEATERFSLRAKGRLEELFAIERDYFKKRNLTGILIIGEVS